AIGIPLYFCRTLSVTFYAFGLAEASIMFWPSAWGALPENSTQLLTAGIIIIVTLLSGKSAELVLKAQIPIFILVIASIIALIAGVLTGPLQTPSFEANYETAPKGFWYVFAVFFPAVTGFTAGIGMSGDLKDPKKSIPIGTIGAVLTCLFIYLLIPVFIASSAKTDPLMIADPERGIEVWSNLALLGSFLIIPAVLGAILSSAFGSILNGPRVLQALADDGLAPSLFSKLSPSGQPAFATWGTGIIALLAVLLGGLNTVAVLVSVLFLTLYVAINLSAAIEVIVAEPHYRPKIKVPWYVSLLGVGGAVFVMFLISPWACLIAIIIEAVIFFVLSRRTLEQNWGDVGSGLLLNIAKRALLSHSKRSRNPRNWRPQILLFMSNVMENIEQVKLGAAIAESKGVLTLCQMVDLDAFESQEDIGQRLERMHEDLTEIGIEAFCEVNVVRNYRNGSLEIARAHGIAGLKSNTIMEGVSEKEESRKDQFRKLISMAESGKNIIYSRFGPRKENAEDKILIWWGGKDNNADLMLLLAHLMRLNQDYRNYEIEIASVVRSQEKAQEFKAKIYQQLNKARIKGKVKLYIDENDAMEIIKTESEKNRVVMLGLKLSGRIQENIFTEWIINMSDKNELTLFVYNAGMAGAIPRLLK
ncbi:MAG: amino acid permease, partial [Bacteroidia bacterium]|nr:amino acid permease [Bacteroidia bacterium]